MEGRLKDELLRRPGLRGTGTGSRSGPLDAVQAEEPTSPALDGLRVYPQLLGHTEAGLPRGRQQDDLRAEGAGGLAFGLGRPRLKDRPFALRKENGRGGPHGPPRRAKRF